MIWNNLFSKKNLQEILQICIIILDCKKFFDSTLIFIILFARNSLNKVLNYYLKFTRDSLNFHSSKNINSKHQSLIYSYLNNFYLFSSWHMTLSQLSLEQLICLKALSIEKFHFYLSMLQSKLRKLSLHEIYTSKNNCFIKSAINSAKSSICWMSFEVSKTWLYNSMNIDFSYKMITKKEWNN